MPAISSSCVTRFYSDSKREIIVKFVSKGKSPVDPIRWLRQFPGRIPTWGACKFVFDPAATEYDWLVAYDDLPNGTSEKLSCPRENTLLVTMEPSSVKLYGASFLRQFGVILTSQEPWATRQPQAIHSQAGLRWYYGIGKDAVRDFDTIIAMPPPKKSAAVSTVCSSKQQGHTLHRKRYQFIRSLHEKIPELEVFGHGVRFIDDKADAIDPYRCHIAIENHVAPHHWTEKLADCFLGWSLPIYHGCPNAADYFPEDSFISINIENPEGALAAIQAAIVPGEYERRLPAIREARRRVLEQYNLFAMLSRIIEQRVDQVKSIGGIIHSRHSLRKARYMIPLLELGWEKLRMKWQAQ